jgi:large subunit ribosomal protein L9
MVSLRPFVFFDCTIRTPIFTVIRAGGRAAGRLATLHIRSDGVGTKIKVLLTQDVEKLGGTGDIKEVSGGYGRNYLIPKGYAILATRGQVKQAEERAVAGKKREQAARKDAEALAARINGQTLRFQARVGELDRLYGSITNSDVAVRLSELVGAPIDRRRVDLEDPIKRVGIYPVSVRLMTGVEPVVNVIVEGEGGTVASPAATEASTSTAELDMESDTETDDSA